MKSTAAVIFAITLSCFHSRLGYWIPRCVIIHIDLRFFVTPICLSDLMVSPLPNLVHSSYTVQVLAVNWSSTATSRTHWHTSKTCMNKLPELGTLETSSGRSTWVRYPIRPLGQNYRRRYKQSRRIFCKDLDVATRDVLGSLVTQAYYESPSSRWVVRLCYLSVCTEFHFCSDALNDFNWCVTVG